MKSRRSVLGWCLGLCCVALASGVSAQEVVPVMPVAPVESSAEPVVDAPAEAVVDAPAATAAPAATDDVPVESEPAVTTPAATDSVVVPAVPEVALEVEPEAEPKPEWYEVLNIRGYTQLRYNGFPTFDSNDDLVNAQGDRSIGGGNGFLIRRARVILYGDVHEQLAVYLQTDFASWIGDQGGAAIVRDWYADVFLTPNREFRLRVGQSKVPYGFENMQSSQNRLALDRNDPLNSAVKDERDMGVFFYWAPAHVRELFKSLVADNLKGSGDYGVLGLGVYNGQTANRFDTNDNLHVVARLTWPFQFGDQVLEAGVGGYVGKYRVSVSSSDAMTYTTTSPTNDLLDRRLAASVMLYPKPFGFTAEYNIGEGPAQGRNNPGLIDVRGLHGGYVLLMYKIDQPFGTYSLIPYVRAQYYRGGKKFEQNAPRYEIDEIELGIEWQIWKALELVAAYMICDRTSSRAPYNQERGHVGRMQLQFNY